MESLLFFFKGIGAGFVVAAPVGPVAVLCIRRTLARGLVAGYATGLGATVADTIYGVIAAYGIGFVATFLFENDYWVRLIGGVILCVLALKTFKAKTVEAEAKASNSMIGDFLSALVVTITNPITVVAFGVVFSSIGVAEAGEHYDWAEALILGVLVGAALWWGSLASIASIFRRWLDHNGLRWLNRISGAVILFCGVAVLVVTLAPDSGIARAIDLSGFF